MDGPNVNWKFFEMLQQEHGEHNGGKQLAVIGTCGLHTLHNAVKAGFISWHMEKILRALHFLFLNVPARREDFINVTGSSTFTLPFCGHRWIENLPVAERALQIWPNILITSHYIQITYPYCDKSKPLLTSVFGSIP